METNLSTVKQAWVFVYLGMFEECFILLLLTGKLKPGLTSEGILTTDKSVKRNY